MRENAVGERRAGLWPEVVMDLVEVQMRHSCRDEIERLSNGRYCAILPSLVAHGENDVRRQRVPQTDSVPNKMLLANRLTAQERGRYDSGAGERSWRSAVALA